MDKAGPFPISMPVVLDFRLPGQVGAALGDLTILWHRDGELVATPTLYLFPMAPGSDRYCLSNQAGTRRYLAPAAEDLRVIVTHAASGYERQLSVVFSDAAAGSVWDELAAGHGVSGSFGEASRKTLALMLHNADVVPLTWDAEDRMLTGRIVLYTDNTRVAELGRVNVTATYASGRLTLLRALEV
jgi:hypothetical protein